jgi:hypothetical protein
VDTSRSSVDTSKTSVDTSRTSVDTSMTSVDTHNYHGGRLPLRFCASFKMSITNIKINSNQYLTKTNCLWERIRMNSKRNDHFRWYFGLSTSKKLKQFIDRLITLKKK